MPTPPALAFATDNCTIGRAMAVLGERWTVVVLREVYNGVRRFDDMRRHTGIPRQVLTNRLAHLVDQGILRREPYREEGQRERHEYRLTEKGFDLYPVMVAVAGWGDRYLADPDGPARRVRPPRLRVADRGAHPLRRRPRRDRPPRRREPPRPRRTPGGGARPASAGAVASRSAASATIGPSFATSRSTRVTTPTLASSPATPRTGAARPRAPASSSPAVATYGGPCSLAQREDRLAGGPAGQRVAGADAVADVEVGPGRLDHRQRERLVAVGDGQVGGAADALGELAEHRDRDVAQHRLHRGREVQHAEPDVQPAVAVAADEGVLLEGADQAVDDGAVDAQRLGERGDREPLRRGRRAPSGPGSRDPASGTSRPP